MVSLSGFLPRVIKVAPACAIMISSYEFGKAFFRKHNKERTHGPLQTNPWQISLGRTTHATTATARPHLRVVLSNHLDLTWGYWAKSGVGMMLNYILTIIKTCIYIRWTSNLRALGLLVCLYIEFSLSAQRAPWDQGKDGIFLDKFIGAWAVNSLRWIHILLS